MSEVTPDETPVQEAPATGIPLTGVSLPADGVMHEVTLDAAPDPKVVTLEKLDHERITANFNYEQVTVVVAKLLEIAGVPAGTITGDDRIISMMRFEDVPLRWALEELRHKVSGTCAVNDQGAVDFSFEAGS